jgi:hypothetical protein
MTLIPTAMARELSALRIRELRDHPRRARVAATSTGDRSVPPPRRPEPVPRRDRVIGAAHRPAR